MPKINITKSVQINAPVEKVFNILNNLSEWTNWSPWLVQDPDAKVDVAEDTKSYTWEGKRIGSGNMRIVNEVENKAIDYDLNFLKPWKSHADVRFEIKETDGGTNVSWHMDSSLPWFMFWMKKMMVGFISMDYQRGLNMLKEYTEKGEIHSKLNFLGFSEYPGCTFIGIKRDTDMENVGKDMSDDFARIWEYFDDKKDIISAVPFSIYHKWDMAKGGVSYTSGVPVSKVPTDLPEDFITGAIPKTRVYTVEHVGSYIHLGNAWTTLYSMKRSKEIKSVNQIHPFETYVNHPGEVPDRELITQVHFAVK